MIQIFWIEIIYQFVMHIYEWIVVHCVCKHIYNILVHPIYCQANTIRNLRTSKGDKSESENTYVIDTYTLFKL